jgi:hypothetical protein
VRATACTVPRPRFEAGEDPTVGGAVYLLLGF